MCTALCGRSCFPAESVKRARPPVKSSATPARAWRPEDYSAIDLPALERELRSSVQGEVRFDQGSRALYATDASNYRQVPVGVVLPYDAEDVEAAVGVCRKHGVPVLSRGGGTSQAGQCCNVAVILDNSKYFNQIVDLDPDGCLAWVQPGVILDQLRDAAEQHHLTFGPDPSTHSRCTLGGMIGNNSCGVHSIMAGNTVDNIEELEVLTYDGLRMRVGRTSDEELARIIAEGGRRGEIYAGLRALRDRYAAAIRKRYPKIPRRVSGYNLDQLLPENGFHVARALVGSEGTCATVLEAVTKLVVSPPSRTLVVLGFSDIFAASDRVMEVMEHGPIGLEGMDDRVAGYIRAKGLSPDGLALLPEGGGWFMVEFGGESPAESVDRAGHMVDHLTRGMHASGARVCTNPYEKSLVATLRESGFGASSYVPGMRETGPGWEDSAVPPERLGNYLRELRGLLDRYGYNTGFYGHYGQGCIHSLIDFDFRTAEGISRFRSFVSEAADLVAGYGGSLSGEHGDGQARGELLPKMFGDELVEAFREFKAIWDPEPVVDQCAEGVEVRVETRPLALHHPLDLLPHVVPLGFADRFRQLLHDRSQ